MRWPGFKSTLAHSVTDQLWASQLISLCLAFLIYKMVIIRVLTLGLWEYSGVKIKIKIEAQCLAHRRAQSMFALHTFVIPAITILTILSWEPVWAGTEAKAVGILFIYLFIYWQHWVFVAVSRHSLVAASGQCGLHTLQWGARASHWSDFLMWH